jgi:microcystin degradation protein MlrC
MSGQPLRIAIGGIRHETNTFSPVWTDHGHFRYARGTDVLGDGLDAIGEAEQVDLVPTFVARARPSGLVRRATYEQLKQELLQALQAALPLDGVYLDLHGALEVQEIRDGESDLVAAVRALVGEDALIAASFDLHGNTSPIVVEQTDILTAFRTAPHRDYAETRQRALRALIHALKVGTRPAPVLIKVPLLLPGEAAVTNVEPARSLYERLIEIEKVEGLIDASILIGCAWTDSPYTSVSVLVVAERDRTLAQRYARNLAREIWVRRKDFGFGAQSASVDDAIQIALDAPEQPVFISDSGDNVTAGGAGDIPLFLERLLALGAQGAVVAGLTDRQAVHQCADAGVGATLPLTIGGKLDPTFAPLSVTAHVEHLSSDPQDRDDVPTIATVRIDSVRALLAVDRRAFTDRASIAAAGVDPMRAQIVVVKQGYLFPDLYDHAPRAIMALSPGATDLQLDRLPYQHLGRPIYPFDADMDWNPQD